MAGSGVWVRPLRDSWWTTWRVTPFRITEPHVLTSATVVLSWCHIGIGFLKHRKNIDIVYTNIPIYLCEATQGRTGYGLDGPGIESQWGARFSAPVQTGPGPHPASCTMGTGGKERPGRDANPSPPSSAVVLLYFYSPLGPYGLYKASMPVQGWPLPYLPSLRPYNSAFVKMLLIFTPSQNSE